MHCSKSRKNSEREINTVIDNILKKDRCRSKDTRKPRRNKKNCGCDCKKCHDTRKSRKDKKNVNKSGKGKCLVTGNETCDVENCDCDYDGNEDENEDTKNTKDTKDVYESWCEKFQISEKEEVNDGIESSARFSLRVMEAMRSLQRSNGNQSLTSSNMKEIIDYIQANYNYDGDLDAQVRTVVSRISRQRFIMSLGKKGYHLVGPLATYMNKNRSDQSSNLPCKKCKRSRSRSRSKSRGSRDRPLRHRKDCRVKPKKGNTKAPPCLKVVKDPKLKSKDGRPAEGQDASSQNNQNKSPSKNEFSQNETSSKNESSPNNRKRCSSRNKKRNSSKKSKCTKRKKKSSDQQCGCSEQNIEFNENYQSESSSNSYITCCEDLSPRNATNEKQPYKKGVQFCGCFGLSQINKNISSSSEEESSLDSVYQGLLIGNSKKDDSHSEDVKKWIKNCRQGCKG